jgi:Glyoxalase/Bleomycin resistance protein/Dioxygenase superfamily
VARHKLADHWRRIEREQRGLRLLDGEPAHVDDPWEALIDRIRAHGVLGQLGAHHRAALTLRYLDGLPVPEVARYLDRTVDASTERARRNGASVEREPTDQPYGRGSVIVDPFGHRWMLLRRPARAGRARPTDPDRQRCWSAPPARSTWNRSLCT